MAVDGESQGYKTVERKMALITDLEKPIESDSPWAAVLLQPRPVPPTPTPPQGGAKVGKKLPTRRSPEEEQQLREAYWRHVALPVPQTFGGAGEQLSQDQLTTVVPGRAWVIPRLLSSEECASIISAGDAFGLDPPSEFAGVRGLRTSKRTGNYCDLELSTRIGPRLPPGLLDLMEETRPHTAVRGIHPNWRVARYDPEDYFSAHYDQADSLTVRTAEGGKERYDSSHTLLISLAERSTFSGGATRLWPEGTYDDTAVDVELPQGYALVFEQRLLHAGLPVRSGTKYIAQAGVLRGQPQKLGVAPTVFRFGPGLDFA